MSAIQGFLYGTSRKDGLPTHDRTIPVEFTADEVVRWHLSKSYGDARRYLGAELRDGRLVFVVRSLLAPELNATLGRVAQKIARQYTYAGSPTSMQFFYAVSTVDTAVR